MTVSGYFHKQEIFEDSSKLASGEIEMYLDKNCDNLREDCILNYIRHVQIVGSIVDRNAQPVKGERVNVVRESFVEGRKYIEIIDTTQTNENGEYLIEICDNGGFKYMVIVEGRCLQVQPIQEKEEFEKRNHKEYKANINKEWIRPDDEVEDNQYMISYKHYVKDMRQDSYLSSQKNMSERVSFCK